MSLRTQFGGYTPETELTASDWTQRFSSDALATVKGLGFSFVSAKKDSSNAQEYIFSAVISTLGKYVIGVFSEGESTGIADVDVDGMSADPVETDNIDDVDVGLFVVDAQSISVGDITVTFNTGIRTSCGIYVWKLIGLDDDTKYHSVQGALGVYKSVNVSNRTFLAGVGGTSGAAVSHHWSGLAERSEQVVAGNEEQSGADRLKVFDASTLEVGMDVSEESIQGLWVAASWVSEFGFFPSGQCVELVKETSDALTLLAWNPPPLSADVETLCLIRPTVQSDSMEIGAAVRGNNSTALADMYAFVLYQSSAGARDQIAILKRDQGSGSVLGTDSFPWSLNTNYWMRFRVRGSTLKGRIWQQGATEPTTWDIEVADSAVTAAGYVGLFHRFTGSQAQIGHFEAKTLYAEWPSTVPQNWDVNIRSGAQTNKVVFSPAVGPTIDRRRASSRIRNLEVTLPGLTLTEYTAFVEFVEGTLKDGTLPFTYTDPFTNTEKTYKFGAQDPLFQEEIMRPVDTGGVSGLYRVTFNLIRLD